ncbi:hypothetical protein WA026_013030 [Henosepilachna vigintioctopunctata]|uniref:Uncharacterized protein n=1 Tax=Henosepilachna vigintioctopunctata TaxID=420089 RepID=A0AAW1UJ35_9CUCU
MIELINLNNLSSLTSTSNKSKAIPTTMKLSNDVNIIINNENCINETASNTAEQTWSTVAAKKIPCRGSVNIVCTGVNNNTDLEKNKVKGAIKKRWMYVGRVAGNEVSESDILAYMDNITNCSNSVFSIGCPDILRGIEIDVGLIRSTLESPNLRALIHEPTRVHVGLESSLHNVITNFESILPKMLQPHLSDHLAISLSLIYPQVIIWRRGCDLREADWGELYSLPRHCVNEMWNFFSTKFVSMFERHFPPITKRVTSGTFNKVPADPAIQRIKNQLNFLYTASRVRPDYRSIYTKKKKEYDETLQRSKQKYHGMSY